MRDMAIGEGALWVVGDVADRRVFKVDLRTGRILHATQLPFAPRSIAVGEGGVWVTGSIDDVLGPPRPGHGAGRADDPRPTRRRRCGSRRRERVGCERARRLGEQDRPTLARHREDDPGRGRAHAR